MKKKLILSALVLAGFVFYQCTPARKASAAAPAVTYENHIEPLVMNNCAPCHFPGKGGNKMALDSYDMVKEVLPDIIRRIELHPGEKGFMPFKRARLSDSTIAVFKAWQEQGMTE